MFFLIIPFRNNLKGISMFSKNRKFISLLLTPILAFSVAGCSVYTDYSLETVRTVERVTVSETSQTEKYIRSSFNTEQNPYFAMLSETEMDAYSLIYEELSDGNAEFDCRIKLNADQLTNAVDAVLYDHPELFWIDNNYGYTYDPADGSIMEIKFNFFDFADTPEKLKKAKAEFDREATAVIEKALAYPTLLERELYIHDYVCENTHYDASAPYNQSAYSVLVLHRSVCAGYSRAFQYLMQKAGYTCYYVTGRAEGGGVLSAGDGFEDGSHSWNIVLLSGEFYNVDCVWDDTASETYGSIIYPFFNVPDEEMVRRTRVQMAVRLPKCTATECKYANHFGPTVEADSIVFAD